MGTGKLMAKFAGHPLRYLIYLVPIMDRETDDVRMASSFAAGMLVQYLTTSLTCPALAFIRSGSFSQAFDPSQLSVRRR